MANDQDDEVILPADDENDEKSDNRSGDQKSTLSRVLINPGVCYFDSNGNLLRLYALSNGSLVYERDGNDTHIPIFPRTTYMYDLDRSPQSSVGTIGNRTTMVYDVEGLSRTIISPSGHRTTVLYNSSSWPVAPGDDFRHK